jgi:hypothetical protein
MCGFVIVVVTLILAFHFGPWAVLGWLGIGFVLLCILGSLE